jgi:hypothetical protein
MKGSASAIGPWSKAEVWGVGQCQPTSLSIGVEVTEARAFPLVHVITMKVNSMKRETSVLYLMSQMYFELPQSSKSFGRVKKKRRNLQSRAAVVVD